MYYRINNEPQIDHPPTEKYNMEIIEPMGDLNTSPGALNPVGGRRTSPANKFPLWLLVVILLCLGLIGLLFFLKINKKYSPRTKGDKSLSFGYNFY